MVERSFQDLQFFSLDLVVQFPMSPCSSLHKVIKVVVIIAII